MGRSTYLSFVAGIVRRPLIGRRAGWSPILMFVGANAPAEAESLVDNFRTEVPFAEVCEDPGTLRNLIHKVAGETGDLGDRVPGSWLPAPRFPLTQIILWTLRRRDELLSQYGDPQSYDNLARSERDKNADFGLPLRDWLRRKTPWRTWTARLEHRTPFLLISAPCMSFLSAWVSGLVDAIGLVEGGILLAAAIITYLAAIPLAHLSSGIWRYRWFARQPYFPRAPHERLNVYLRRVAEASKKDNAQMDLLLVCAFLEDLRSAYRRRIFSPGWARNGYSTVLLKNAGIGTAGWTFIHALHTIAETTGDKAPLLVVASTTRPIPAITDHSHLSATRASISTMARAFTRWDAGVRRLAPCPYLVVETGNEHVAEALDQKPRLRRRRVLSRYPAVLYWTVVASAVCLPFAVIWQALR